MAESISDGVDSDCYGVAGDGYDGSEGGGCDASVNMKRLQLATVRWRRKLCQK